MGKRVLVIGAAGRMGRAHLRFLSELGCEIYGYDTNPELVKMVDDLDLKVLNDLREVDYIDLDGVIVAVPPTVEVGICRYLLSRDLKILCEKPVGVRCDEVEDLMRVEKESNGWIMVGFTMRFNRAIMKMKEIIESGRLGEIIGVNARKCWKVGTKWRLEKGGGVILIKDIHYFDLVPWMLKRKFEKVLAIGGTVYHDAEVEDCYSLLATLKDRVFFSLMSAWWNYDKGESFMEILGRRDRLVLKGSSTLIFPDSGEELIFDWEDPLKVELIHFLKMLDSDTLAEDEIPGLEEALHALKVADCVKRSMEEGMEVKCD
ncbi:MAG: hypothetical protein DRP30_00275 [Thermotoga sp.]|nr:MAG: hypothetical protein DRP30_00275 [Thermotoga sp.]